MMRSIFTRAFVGAAALLLPAPSYACADFSVVGNAVDLPYNPFDAANFSDNFTIKINPAPGTTATSIRFLLIDTTPRGGLPRLGEDGPAAYDVVWQSDPSRTVFTLGSDSLNDLNGAVVEINSRRAVQTTFRLSIPRGQTALAGRQAEEFAIRYQCYAGRERLGTESEQPASNRTEYALRVPRLLTAFLSGQQTRGLIDFGTINALSSLTRSIIVSAQSTLPYSVEVASENGGAVISASGGRINYGLKLSGAQVTGGSTVTCPVTPAPSGYNGALEVALSRHDVASQPAGAYADTISLTFKADESFGGPQCTVRQRRDQ